MDGSIFINYRRDDTEAWAGRLHDSLKASLGENAVFLDTSSVPLGSEWPQTLRSALEKSTLMVALIGPNWLQSHDEFGRRRLDQEGDWVTSEIKYALDHKKLILPVRIGIAELPPANALPSVISRLIEFQAGELRDTNWSRDVTELLKDIRVLLDTGKLAEGERGRYPKPPKFMPEPINDDTLQIALEEYLSNWEVRTSSAEKDGGVTRTELYRRYEFASFLDAISFMKQAGSACDIMNHHPRWENIWRSVDVYLTTWDIEDELSDRDVQLARHFDLVFADYANRKAKKK